MKMNINNVNAISHYLGKSHSNIDKEDNELNERNDGFASVLQNTASDGRNDSSTGTRRRRSASVAEAGAEGGAGVGLADLVLGLTAQDIHNDMAATRRILSSSRPGVPRLSHPTNGGTTMMLLTESDGSISNPRNDISEGQVRVGARTPVREVTTHEDKRGDWLQEGVGNHQVDSETQVSMDVGSHVGAFDLDDQLLAVAFRGWIDELDIYERKGCRFLKRKRTSV